MEHIKTLLAKHEALKSKGLRLVEQDIHTWIGIYDSMIDISVELESQYEEAKRQLENDMDTRHILLKDSEGWSDKITWAKVKKEFEKGMVELAKLKKYKTLAKSKLSSIEHYINEAKRIVK